MRSHREEVLVNRLTRLMREAGILGSTEVIKPTPEELDEIERILAQGYEQHIKAHGMCSQREFVHHCLRGILSVTPAASPAAEPR